ncbi:c-type cytochrome biogenesis protein CcmI [Aureimonas frigidaquae]|uniref:c-type cytochrome biogenesis protein CcmI n=1 Tax=Aureimonas frigidaquae TaxID=424757 RepID=UPI000784828D|nr:c-type cytochrome biogenesis protein CcmI [Aureimonas frigidaquae]
MFWIIAGALTLVVTLAAVWPLLRRQPVSMPSRAAHDVSVYAAQLDELSADLRRGAIGTQEERIARAEIGRRLIKADRAARQMSDGTAARAPALAIPVLIVVPLLALIGYWNFGTPQAGDMPLALRAAEPAPTDVAALVARAEARLATNPEEGQGWDVLAPIYLRMGDAQKAVTAFGRASELLGPSPARLSGLGEAQVMQAEGRVTDAAAASFRAALALDPQILLPRFFLALQLSQEDRFAEAAPAWEALIAGSPDTAPWMPLARAALDDARGRLGGVAGATSGPAVPPPSQDAVAAMAQLPEQERQAQIAAMVDGLAARLEAEPDDIEGWKRLIRSYSVLGDGTRAREAVSKAQDSFAEGSPERAQITGLGQELGLTPTQERSAP